MHTFILITALTIGASLGFAQERPDSFDERSKTPLMLAIEADDLSQVKQLVENGADVNDHDMMLSSPLKLAISKKNQKILIFITNHYLK